KVQKIAIAFFMMFVGSGIISCDAELDIQPESEISTDFFYSTADEVGFAVIAIYNSLHNMMNVEWMLTELRSDNTYMNVDSSSSSDTPLRSLDRYEVTSTNEHVEEYYR